MNSRNERRASTIRVGRLKPGVTLQQAQAEISAIMLRLGEQYPGNNRTIGALVEPLREGLVREFQQALYVLLAASGCLLLIGCMNLSILLIGRRAREMSVRAALGASAGRLRHQILAEVLPLSVAGVAGGLLLALGLLKAVQPWLPPTMPLIDTIGLHRPALIFCIGVSFAVVFLAGVLPARVASRIHLAQALQQESRAVAGRGGIRNTLVIAQVAVTLVLLAGAGLLSRSLVALLQVNPGFVSDRVLTMHLAVTRAQYPEDAQVAKYYERLVALVRDIPGVEAVGIVNRLPLSGINQTNPIQAEIHQEVRNLSTDTRSITPGYFDALGIPVVAGRGFTEDDRADRPFVSIIDQPLARRLFGDADPLGKRIRIGLRGRALDRSCRSRGPHSQRHAGSGLSSSSVFSRVSANAGSRSIGGAHQRRPGQRPPPWWRRFARKIPSSPYTTSAPCGIGWDAVCNRGIS